MHSLIFTLFTAALASSLVAAQNSSTTYIQVIEAGTTRPPTLGIAGSIVGVNAVATTVAVVCTVSNSDCPELVPWTMTLGSSTFSMSAIWSTYTAGVAIGLTLDENCKITSSTAGASCTNSVAAVVAYDGQSTSTATVEKPTFSAAEITYQSLLITAGVEKFHQSQATQTPVAAAGRIGIGMGCAAMAAAVSVIAIGLM